LSSQEKYDEAIEKYKKAIEINPKDKDAYNN
jgi:tetratricopeptide (TPR) repeat protein